MTDIFEVPIPNAELLDKAEQLRLASIKTSQTNNNERIRALNLMADSLEKNSKEIIEANIEDYKKNLGINTINTEITNPIRPGIFRIIKL